MGRLNLFKGRKARLLLEASRGMTGKHLNPFADF